MFDVIAHVAVGLEKTLAANLLLDEEPTRVLRSLHEAYLLQVGNVASESPLEHGCDILEVVDLNSLPTLVEELELHFVRFLEGLAKRLPQLRAYARLQADSLELTTQFKLI